MIDWNIIFITVLIIAVIVSLILFTLWFKVRSKTKLTSIVSHIESLDVHTAKVLRKDGFTNYATYQRLVDEGYKSYEDWALDQLVGENLKQYEPEREVTLLTLSNLLEENKDKVEASLLRLVERNEKIGEYKKDKKLFVFSANFAKEINEIVAKE